MRREDIEGLAQEILDSYRCVNPPVPVGKIVAAQGIVIVESVSSGTESGFALSHGARRIIGVNSNTALLRQRFTIGHELGHLLLHHRQLIVDHAIRISKRDNVSSLGTEAEEVEANAFAAAILMPEKMVRAEFDRLNFATGEGGEEMRDSTVKELAKRFDVSQEAMTYRLAKLNLITGWF